MKRAGVAVFARVVLVSGLALSLAGAACSAPPRAGGAATPNQAAAARAAITQAARPLPPGAGEAETVEARLAELFGLCQAGDVDAAAGYFVYRGPDKGREWKDTYRPGDPAERAAVRDGCARIKGYLDGSEGHTFGPVKVERESEGEWHVVEVSFRRGGEAGRAVFALLPVKGRFAVGDID